MTRDWQNQDINLETLGFMYPLTVGFAATDEDRRACIKLLALHNTVPTSAPTLVATNANYHHRDYLAVWDHQRSHVIAAAALHQARHTYAPAAFELGAHFELRPLLETCGNRVIELSQLAVDPAYRAGGNALQLLFKGITAVMDLNSIDRVITSLTITRKRGDSYLFSVLDAIRRANDGREAMSLRPWLRLPTSDDFMLSPCRLPTQLKCLLRMDAYVHPEPAWDAQHNRVVVAAIVHRYRMNRGIWNRPRRLRKSRKTLS